MKFYKLGDTPTRAECDALGVEYRIIPAWESERDGDYLRAVRIFEFRSPRKGEWYLSGSSPMAWRAPNDYGPNMQFQIAKLVVIRKRTTTTETLRSQ